MAAVTANADIRKFHTNGGTITFNDGTDTYTLKNLDPGGTSWQDGGFQVHEFHDEGELQQPLAGNEIPSKIDVAWRLGDLANSTSNTIFDLFAQGPTTGKKKEYTVVIKIPDHKGATTGTQITYAETYLLAKPICQSESDGNQFGICRVSMHSRTIEGVRAEY